MVDKMWTPCEWIRVFEHEEMVSLPMLIRLMNSPFYDGDRFAVRQGNDFCLNKDGILEWEPRSSERDDEFYERCRFKTFEDAEAALAKMEKIMANIRLIKKMQKP